MTVEEAQAGRGRRVVYEPPGGPAEFGKIVRLSPMGAFVFVRYDGEIHAKATPPERLRFAEDDE